MDTIVNTATSTFNTTIGFTLADAVDWGVDLLKLILGTGLAVLESLMPVILVLGAIGACVYIAYRAFRFFRH